MRCVSCTLPQRDLIALLDGEVSPAVAARAAGCPVCQGHLAEMRATRLTLRAATPLRDDPGSRALLRARLNGAAERERTGWPRLRQPHQVRLALPLILLLLVAAGDDLLGRDAPSWLPRCIIGACDLARPASDDRPVAPSTTAMRLEARLNQSRALAWTATTAARRDAGGWTARGVPLPMRQPLLTSGVAISPTCARAQTPAFVRLALQGGLVGCLPADYPGLRRTDARATSWR